MVQTSYPYAVSRIKASENSFIDNTLWGRLWEADQTEAFRLLHDIGYGKTAQNQNDIDDLTQASLSEARELVNEITPDPHITDLYVLQVDGHNIKTLLKGLLQREEVDNILLPGGTIPLAELKTAFEDDNYDQFPLKLREAIEAFDPSEPPGILSAHIDNAVYAQIFYVLSNKKTFNELSDKFFKSRIDFTNILSILRAKNLNWNEEQIAPMIIPGGECSKDRLFSALKSDETGLIDKLSIGLYSNRIREGLNEYFKEKNIAKLENTFFRISFDIIHNEFADSFGIGPILNYLLQKEFEARTLRVLFAAKRTGKEISLADLGINI